MSSSPLNSGLQQNFLKKPTQPWLCPIFLYSVQHRTVLRWLLWLDENPLLDATALIRRSLLIGLPFQTFVDYGSLDKYYPLPPVPPSRPECFASHYAEVSQARGQDPAHVFQPWYNQVSEMLSRLHGRAFLLRGGILWRLALQVMGERLVDQALGSFSEETRYFKQGLSQVKPASATEDALTLLDDTIQPFEELILLGGWKDGDTVRSFWPDQDTLEAMGLWAGEWSEVAERWFERRWELFSAGRGQALARGLWVKNSRPGREVRCRA